MHTCKYAAILNIASLLQEAYLATKGYLLTSAINVALQTINGTNFVLNE